jgi:hypothetical protein
VLTVHDVGTNPLHSFIIPFANSTVLSGLFERAIFIHVCVPGQEGGAADFYGKLVLINLNQFPIISVF